MVMNLNSLETARSRRVSSRRGYSSKSSIDSINSRRSSQRNIPCKRWKKMEVRLNLQPPMRAQCKSVVLKDQLYLFGGMGAGPCNALWRLDLKDSCWHCMSRLPGRAPSPRTQHSICSDGISRFFIFGGTGEIESGLDVLRTTNDQNNHPVRIRALGKRVVCNDLYRFDVESNSWAMLQVAGASPSPRRGHTATMISTRTMIQKLVPMDPDETCSISGTDNLGSHKRSPDSRRKSKTLKKSGSQNTFQRSNSNGSLAKLQGGIRNLKAVESFKSVKSLSIKEEPIRASSVQSFLSTNDNESENAENVSAVSNQESQPMQSVMVPHTRYEIVVVGGAGPESVKGVEIIYAETWVYSLDDNHWTQPSVTGCTPPARFDHTATLLGNNIFIIGGLAYEYAAHAGDNEPEREVMVLNTEFWTWSVLQTNLLGLRPPALFGHTSIEDPNTPGRILIFGGRSLDELTNELWSLNTAKCLWTKTYASVEPDGPANFGEKPACRYGHILVAWDPDWKEKLDQSEVEDSLKDEESVASSTRRMVRGRAGKNKAHPKALLSPASHTDKGWKQDFSSSLSRVELASLEDKPVNTKLVLFGGYLLEPGKGYSSGDTYLLENEKVRMISRRNSRNRRNSLTRLQEEAARVLATASSVNALSASGDEDHDGIPDEYEDPIQMSIQTLEYVDHAVWDRFFNKPLVSGRTSVRTFKRSSSHFQSTQHQSAGELDEPQEIPSSYSDMKEFLLGIRPDKRTSKINPRDKRQIATAPEIGMRDVGHSLPAIRLKNDMNKVLPSRPQTVGHNASSQTNGLVNLIRL